MLEKYKNEQLLFYNYVTNSFKNGKISHAFLVEANGFSKAFDLCIDFAKFLLCNDSYDKNICDQIDSNTYSDFLLIDSDKVIKKEQITSLQRKFSLKSSNGNRLVYIIKNAELLNDSSANSLLKFLEEPEEDIVAILLANNVNNVKNTIVSRCQVISLINNQDFNYEDIFDYCDGTEKTIINEYDNFMNFYTDIEKQGVKLLKNRNLYDDYSKITQLLKFGLYLYFDIINDILDIKKKHYLPDDERKKVLLESNDLNSVSNKIEIINNFLTLERYNLNKNLFFDNFVIKFGGENI